MFRLWLQTQGQSFDGFMFDVRLGGGRPTTLLNIRQVETQLGYPLVTSQQQQDYIDGQIRVAWQALTAKRADAIGFRGDETWLIEVKKILNMSLLGQMLIYSVLLLRDSPPDGSFHRAVIVGDIDPEVYPVAQEGGIVIFQVPMGFP
jgi:hypothetical protein